MLWSLWSSNRRNRAYHEQHGDIDQFANRMVFAIFLSLIGLQIVNVLLWHQFGPLLAAMAFNLAGAAMQSARLMRSAFHE